MIALLVGTLYDIGVGLVTTFLGIFVVYVFARPRILFSERVIVSRRQSGKDRYRIRFKTLNRFLPVVHLQVKAWVSIPTPGRATSVPVPLSREEWFEVRSPRSVKKWTAVPRLLLDEIAWRRHLPPEISTPGTGQSIEDYLRDRDARIIVTVLATSAVFSVSCAHRQSYRWADFTDSQRSAPVS